MDIKHFLDSSPTAYHACYSMQRALDKKGFIKLQEHSKWSVKLGAKYYVTRNDGSLIAFITPLKKPEKALLSCAHTDSPALKLKPNGEYIVEGMTMLHFEVYGSPILPSWIGRDLYLAGRIFYEQAGRVVSELVEYSECPFIIPNLALHLDRQVNDNGLLVHKQDQLAALVSCDSKPFLDKLVKKNLLYHELYAVPCEKALYLGTEQKLVASSRLDNLAHVASNLEVMLKQKPSQDTLKMMAVFNFEEVGSQTQEGAASSFFDDSLERLLAQWNCSKEEFFCFKAKSQALSCDVTHAVHPAYLDRHDARHRVKLGAGNVIKTNAQCRYVTDGSLAAHIAALWQKKKVDYQYFSSRNDIPCGTTIGPIFAAKTGFATVDLGMPLLGMHAAREVIHLKDYESFVKGLEVLYAAV